MRGDEGEAREASGPLKGPLVIWRVRPGGGGISRSCDHPAPETMDA